MRILIVTQYFYPENFKSNDIAFELVKRGYKVDALVSIPNYPEGVYYKGYGIFHKRKELINGVNVYRVFQTPRGKTASSLGLSLNYLTYMINASLWSLFFFMFKKKYDAIIVFEVSPITQAIPAIILGNIKKTKVYTWVLDIWPDAAFSNIKSGFLQKILNNITNFVYSHSDKILISSQKFKDVIFKNWRETDKLIYFPNWCDDVLKLSNKRKVELPKGFNIVLIGNIGTVQLYQEIYEIILNCKDLDINWLFVGGGSLVESLREWVRVNNMYEKVYIYGKYPYQELKQFYIGADLLLLTLQSKKTHLNATVPARLQSYMSAGKTILSIAGDGCSQLINQSNSGFAFRYNDVNGVVECLKNMMENKSELVEKGNNARKFYLNNFQKNTCISNLENIINNTKCQ